MFLNGEECKILNVFMAEICPCKDCIVKMVCESVCGDFNKILY